MKDVICLAVGQTYDMVLDTKITAHPDVAPYPRDDYNYLIPIKKGGTLEFLYNVKQKISCLPEEVYKYKGVLSAKDYKSLIEYHERRRDSFGYGKEETNYVFYILGESMLIEQPFEKKGIQVSFKMDIEDVPVAGMKDIIEPGDIPSDCLYVAITDTEWFEFIRNKLDEGMLNKYINFWTPGKKAFKALRPGGLFLFKLHSNAQREENGEIVGGAYFCGYERMQLAEAWDKFGNGNGTGNLQDIEQKITKYRERNDMEPDSEIGCVILENPFFFEEWIEEPVDWNKNIVSGKKYDLMSDVGKDLFKRVYQSVGKKDYINEIEKDLDTYDIEGSERLSLIKVRVNQSVFRNKLLDRYKHCCLCNVENSSLLIASHIKPWVESETGEKLDVDNGLLLCPNHDALFDNGYISFDDNGKIMISEHLSQVDRIFMNVNYDMKIEMTSGNKKYMKYHREHILK